MVDYCAGLNSLNCVIELNNTYNIKLIILVILGLFSLLMLYMSYRNNWETSLFDYLLNLLFRWFGYGYLLMSPLIFSLFLRPSVDFELFIILLIVMYMIIVVLGVGLALLGGTKYILKFFFNIESFDKIKERQKYKTWGKD